jgi:hypothetical protein
MSVEFLDVELAEIGRQRGKLDLAAFNVWMDGSPIKGRLKKAYLKEQKLRCCYCRRFNDDHNSNLWDLEHVLCEDIYPQLFADIGNLAVCCKRCNGAKKNKDVMAAGMPPDPAAAPADIDDYTIPHPQLTNWSDHLKHTHYLIYEKISDKGEELISVCELNGKAEEGAGFTVGAIRASIANRYFQKVGNRIPSLTDDLACELAQIAQDETERLRYNLAARRLRRALQDYERRNRTRYGASA